MTIQQRTIYNLLILIILGLLSKTQNYVFLLAILSAKDDQKLSKLLSKGFERPMYWNEYKTKNENKNATNDYRYFLESNSVGVNMLFVLV